MPVCCLPAARKVSQRLHQQVGAEGGAVQVRLQVLGTQGDLTAQAGLYCNSALTVPPGRAAVTQHHPLLLLALQAHKVPLPAFLHRAAAVDAPGLPHAGWTEAMATGQ